MKKEFDVVALGELLIDFVSCGSSDRGNPILEANPGGAPCNVLSMLARLGRRCGFIGKVGQDAFGDQLEAAIREVGIDPRGLRRDPAIPTTLAVVHNQPDGERSFQFYRKPGADVMLAPEELDVELLCACRIFHFGSLSLTDEPSRSATVEALRLARNAGALVSYDPNLRMNLWPDPEQARTQIRWGLTQCDVLKISDDELAFTVGTPDFDAAAARLMEAHPNLKLICITAGADGSHAYVPGLHVHRPGCSRGGVIETTGAGDTFCGCMLNYLLDHPTETLGARQLEEMLDFANAAAYLVTTRRGALRVMPTREEVQALL